ncbi:hypothetical protein [Cerasicoccus maritimus]|uniref:hypothetical protein n=1 Tax=Cerasicoccus maritimus TaxID=490089 RepID=UPI002852D790|nr:hypothetical protein [Cerasicoccus maritimus]
MTTLHTVNEHGFHFKKTGKGGTYSIPFSRLSPPIELLEGATSGSWDANTFTLTYFTTDEAGERMVNELDITQAQIDEAAALIGVPDPNVALPVPAQVTVRQLRLWLNAEGHDVDAVINAMPEPGKSEAQIAWEYATIYERDDPLVDGIGSALGLTSAQIDQAFRDASQL